MRFALNVPNFGLFADVAAMVELARVAERSGWDGHEIAELAQLARVHGPHEFDIVVGGRALDDDAHLLEPFATAGATWWQEPLGSHYETWDDVLARAQHGPPQLGQ